MTLSRASSDADVSTSGRDAAWIAYVLHAIGYLSVMMWPALIGLVINYAKPGDVRGGYVDSHHEWLIRTFWFGLLWYLLSFGALLWSAWPVLQSVLRAAPAQGTLVLDWSTIFAVLGAATLGGIGLLATWLWLLYRVLRGVIAFASSKPMP